MVAPLNRVHSSPREAAFIRLTLLALLALVMAWGSSACGNSKHSTSSAPAPLAPEQPLASHNPTDGSNVVRVSVFNASGKLTEIDSPRVVKSDAEWKKLLTPEQYAIARGKGTERPFCGTLLKNHLEGVYSCICCNLPLFSSDSKFDSGTGWPSFFRAIARGNVAEHEDRAYGMVRTEILCARCDGHLGHVFEDGPPPTGLRYCLNSESLIFTKSEDVAKLAESIPASAPASKASEARAVFAGGCFWCVEAVFEELEGVKEVISGYAGGAPETANYKAVCSGTTGHAEAVEIRYDPTKISFEDLLRVHFATHDPTTLNRQGADEGTQYRSAIFFANDEQRRVAEAFIQDLTDAKAFSRPIVTTLEALPEGGFYEAETYHQGFVCNNPNQGYVRAVALPKVDKVRKAFKERLKKESPLGR